MRPDATTHNPSPIYLRSLVKAAGGSQKAVAARIGVDLRTLTRYLCDDESKPRAPYTVQFALEREAHHARLSARRTFKRRKARRLG